MKSAKRVGYKLIVAICIILILLSFFASAPVNAAGKVSTEEFYYSGTTKGSYTIEKSMVSKIIDSLGSIADYLVGGILMIFRAAIVGWTALLERCLTWILESATGEDIDIDKVDSTTITGSDDYITLDAIFFNRVPLLDINFFKFDVNEKYTATGKTKEVEDDDDDEAKALADAVELGIDAVAEGALDADQKEEENQTLVMVLKNAVAGWYYTFRAISFMVMFVMLIYIGIKLAIHSATKEKALYKKVLLDWVIGMILVFSIHYIMMFMINFNDVLVDAISNLRRGTNDLAVYEYGLIERAAQPIQNDEIEITLYNEVKTRAYDAKLTVGTSGMIMYMVLVYYAWKYTFIYLKRYLTIAVLTMMAPLVAASYAFNKVRSGKSIVFSKWFKEYLFSVLLQSIHALLYVVFLDVALRMSLNSIASIILSFAMLNMMAKSEDLFRKIFGIKGTLTLDIAAGGGLKDAFNEIKGIGKAMAGGKMAKAYMGFSTRVLTKPLRAAGEKAFNEVVVKGYMVPKAEEKYNQEKNGSEQDTEKAKEQKRLTRIERASLGKAIATGEINVKELEDAVGKLKVGQEIRDDNNQYIGTVDEDYIKKEKQALEKIQEVDRIMKGVDKYGNKVAPQDLAKEYDKMTTKMALTKQYISDKWEEIIDPYQYTKKTKEWEETGEDGEIIKKAQFEAIEKKRQSGSAYETAIGKALFGGKVTDSASKRFLDNLKPDNLLNLNDEQKKALTAQMDFAKKGITGFAGIMAGLPLLIAEPKLGAVFLYQGITNMSEVTSFRGKRQQRALKRAENLNLDPKTRYILTGFAGGSAQTIAEGAKFTARMQVQELEEARREKDRKIVKRIKKKFPKLAEKLEKNSSHEVKFGAYTGSVVGAPVSATVGASIGAQQAIENAGLVTVSTISAPVALGIAVGSLTATAIYKSHIGDNIWSDFNAVAMASRKANWKAFEKQMKFGYSASYLDKLADQYFEFEDEQAEEYSSRHEEKVEEKAKTLGAIYTAYLADERQKIDEMSDEELLLENNYEEPIIYHKETVNGVDKKILGGASKRALIDEAIIQSAKSIGVINIKEFELTTANIDDVTKRMTDNLRMRGIIYKNEDITVLLGEDIKKQIENRTSTLVRIEERRSQEKKPTLVEEKMVDEAIIEVMKQGDESGKIITVPTKVDSTKVQEVLKRNYENIVGVKPTEETANVLSSMQKGNQKSEPNDIPGSKITTESFSSEIVLGRAKETIEDRKETLEKKSKKSIYSKELKRQLKKKREFSLDRVLIENQAQLDETKVPNTELDTYKDIYQNTLQNIYEGVQEDSHEEPIEVEFKIEDGVYKRQLTDSSENLLINQAIIQTAKSSGITELSRFDTSPDNIAKITKFMTDYLRNRGLIEDGEDVTNVVNMDEVKEKIEHRRDEIANNPIRNNIFGSIGEENRAVGQAIDSARRTDSVLKMLELQTQMHKEKVALQTFNAQRKDKEFKRQLYITELFSESQATRRVEPSLGDGSRRVVSDGSRRVASYTKDGSRKVQTSTRSNNRNASSKKVDSLSNQNIDELLKTFKRTLNSKK